MPNIFRKLLVKKLRENGGYSGYHDCSPILYTVCFLPDLSLEHIAKLADYGRPIPKEIVKAWDENNLWSNYQELAVNGLDDWDTYRTYSPATAARFGLPYYSQSQKYRRKTLKDLAYYPAGKEGWIKENPYVAETFDVEFTNYGRGGKRVCVTRFEGINLNVYNEDLIEHIETGINQYGSYVPIPNKWCQKLLAMMHEWEELITEKAIKDNAEYMAAEDLRYELIGYYKEQEERQYWEDRDVITTGE